MLTALDTPLKALDEVERSFVAQIREHGWFTTGVQADAAGPGFCYTTGFWVNTNTPEIIMFGLKGATAHDVFWDLFRGAQAGKDLWIGRRTDDVFGNSSAYVFPVALRYYADYLGWTRWFYNGDDFPCLQIVWPDRAGLFPWQPGFDPALIDSQPDVTEYGWLAALAN